MPPIDPRELLPTERPSTSVPDPGFRYNINPGSFGAASARGLESFGQDVFQAGKHWGEIAADDMANQFTDQANKLLHGDPNAKNADGSPAPTNGFLDLKGEEALKQHGEYDKRLTKLFNDTQGKLWSADQQKNFNAITRIYRQRIAGEMGRHADREGVSYGVNVNKASIKLGAQDIAAHPDDEDHFLHTTADMVNSAAKMAEVQGYTKGSPVWNEHVEGAKAAAAEARIYSVGAKDPVRAMQMTEHYKDVLGNHYHTLYSHLRPQVDKQEEHSWADSALQGQTGGGAPNAAGLSPATQASFDRAQTALKAKGIDIGISSGARTPEANQAAGGAGDSQHLHGGATDIPWRGKTDEQKAEIVKQFASDPSVGGIGFYDSHIHVDNKAGRRTWGTMPAWATGAMAEWKGNSQPASRPSIQDQTRLLLEAQEKFRDKPDGGAAAMARITRSYSIFHAQQTAQRAVFNQQVDDSKAEAAETGASKRTLTQDDFLYHYGDVEGPAKFADYKAHMTLASDFHAVKDLSDVQQRQYLDSHKPDPTSAGYAVAAKRHEQLETAVGKIQTFRREDPSGAVAKSPVVAAAMAQYDEKDPATFAPVVQARLAEQQRLGIEPEYQSPITKPEALKAMLPVQQALPGQKMVALEQVAEHFQKTFGDKAQQAFLYSLRAMKISGEAAKDAESVLSNLAAGKPLTEQDRKTARDAADVTAMQSAIQQQSAAKPGPTESWMFADPMGSGFTQPPQPSVEPSKPVPNNKALADLRDNKMTAADFDKAYGAGMSKKLMEEYPFFFNRPPKK